ncbi:hypothetical protein [Chelativorans sp. J32]|uniref:hypothetical protein n=1 Tax=Chelativorans sp. J32 TaxID=935840 RepID=UPI000481A9DB|nr:hypothetical protein [Chelativorans sp. J32]
MTRFLAASVFALAIAVTPLSSSAQDSARSNADTLSQHDPVEQNTTAGVGAAADFGTVISAIQNSGEIARQIRTLGDVSNLRIVRVSDIANAASAPALENAIRQNLRQVEELRSAMKENTILFEHLQQEGIQADDAVAATETGGQLVVYIR